MRITKNPEVKGLLAMLTILSIVFLGVTILINLISIRHFKNSVNYNNSAIVGALVERYPELENDIIVQIQNRDKHAVTTGQDILARYGLDNNDFFLDTQVSKETYRMNVILYLPLIVVVCVIFIIVIIWFLNNQYNRINDIALYLRKIQNKDYTLDIRDNSEGDVSILKNEIYKITTMLREQADSLRKDKTTLADSIADISHQLKTPMTSMFVLNDLLYDNLPEETRVQFLDRIKSQLERIQWLVSSLLKLSKLDAGTVIMKKETVVVRDLIQKVIEPLCIPIEIKMLSLNINGDDNVVFTGDFRWTCEALVNILKNCIEQTPEQGSIAISFEENPIYTVISIKDDGPGIDREDMPYIFNRFYRGKNASEDSVGIGLAMARAIVSKQGGDITVESQKGFGTEFTIKFYKSLSTK